LLTGLLADAHSNEFRVLVVANGCSDDTAAVAAAHGPMVRVVSTPIASKAHALKIGKEHATGFPRLYVDADVELRTRDARALADALREPDILAAAPTRLHAVDGCPLAVRWYFDVWERLPVVDSGLFGRGVVAVNEIGQQRLDKMPEAMGDDLLASIAFAAFERRIVPDAQVVIYPPRSTADLVRTRVRTLTVVAELERQLPEQLAGARTTKVDLLRAVRTRPAIAPRMLTFLAITMLAKLAARRAIRARDFTTWLRDESTRTIPTQRIGGSRDVKDRA
jgi:Glycosyl transferase family 2